MTETKRPLKVFLCHAHSDKDTVKALYNRLTDDGVDAWLDKEKLLPGENWRNEIRKAVQQADVVIVCHSKDFNQQGFRQREVRWALDTAMEKPDGEIFIIPARLEICDVLDSLSDWHWVDLFEDNGYEMLMRALQARAKSIDATLQVKKKDMPKATSSLSKREKEAEISSVGTPISILYPEKPVENKQIDSSSQDFSSIRLNSNSVIQTSIPREEIKESLEQLPSGEKFNTTFVENNQDNKVAKSPKKKFKLKTEYIVVIGAVATITVGLLGSSLIEKWFSPVPTASATATLTITPHVTVTVTSTKPVNPTVTPLPTEITDAKGVSMVLVPSGQFIMGSDRSGDENPIHTVYLDAFYMDIYEVTNSFYKACVDAGNCKEPLLDGHYGSSLFDRHPVANIDWDQARAYCAWRGGNLPTEAQWEKAARSTDGRKYPWGMEFDGTRLNFCDKNCSASWAVQNSDDGYATTAPVGNFESGKSSYGIYDLAGNVWEWVADWYSDSYYQSSATTNPLGPESGQYRVIRGASWGNVSYGGNILSSNRDYRTPNAKDSSIGFRCVKNTIP